MSRGQVRERSVTPVGKDLCGLGMAPVVLLGLKRGERRVGEDSVVAPDGEQLVLVLPGPAVQVADAADDQPCSDRLARARGERRVLHLCDLGVGDPAAELIIPYLELRC